MKDFEHLMTVWQGQPVKEQLSVDEALKTVKKGMNGLSRKLMWGIVAIVITTVVVVYLALFGVFMTWTSDVGLLVLSAGMITYLVLQVGDYRTLSKHDPTMDPVNYLDNLKTYQKRRAYLYGRFWYIFALIVTAGMSFYTYEVLERQSLKTKVICYVLWFVYIMFATFYLKDRITKNEKEKVSLMIEKLERLQDQFE
jgi:FtsH-binding integral membrane protein